MEMITGSVERVTFYNPENGYTVLRLFPARRVPGGDRDGFITVTGNLPEVSAGEHLRIQGQWVNHPKHGRQFQAEVCEQIMPASLAGMRRYLGSGLVKGIGPRLAERIVAHFGMETLSVIEEHPERLGEVPDIGPKRSRLIYAAWQEQKKVKEIMLFLHGYGVSTNLAVKIYKQYGDQALEIVQSDPYRLAQDIYGVGFKTADKIAQSLGLPVDHPSRIEAGIVHLLGQKTDDGHVYFPGEELMNTAAELLGVEAALVYQALERLASQDRIHVETVPFNQSPVGDDKNEISGHQALEAGAVYGMQAVYLTPLYMSELSVSQRLREYAASWPTRLSDLPAAFVDIDSSLSEEQRSAVRTCLNHPVSVLTGGPGTGKTTTIRALIAIVESASKHYALACPTGRAAKRLAQATEKPASTIHRLLGFTPGEGFKYNASNPLDIDLLVIDEVSMLDLILANHLLKAIRPGTHLLLVGDVDQLPSVGAGDVLRDIIQSGTAPVTCLNTIFRQAANSQIITNAHRINQGMMPIFSGSELGSDFFLFPAETPDDAANWVEDVVCNRIPAKFNLHPRDDIQVLAPMYRGPVGVDGLNARLQARLNPATLLKPEKSLFGTIFRLGDKVMQIQNNYDLDVFNGDIGYINAINAVEHSLTVEFEGRAVTYDWGDCDQLVLAYAISVHKSQGSEFTVVVLPVMVQHYLMLQRNLLYTAITRAKKLCVLVGNRKAIGIAVRNDKVTQRYSALDWRLGRS